MTTALQTLIESLPKTELHVHLEGTLEPDMSLELARKNGITLPFRTPEEVMAAYDFRDLPSFLAIYYPAMNVLQDESDFFALTWAYLAKARAQNVVYAELFFDPQAHTARGVPFATVITGIRRAQERAARELGIDSQLILCFLRDLPAESALATLQQALPFKEWLVGVGLDSDEKHNPPAKFAEVFAQARAAGLKLTMHCDVNQLDTLEHIRQVLHDIRVDRIDHGINSLEDPELCREIAARGIGLTVCPVSNRFVVQDLTTSHIRRMLESGMRATINSDDPAYFRAYVNENYAALAEDGMTREELVQLVRNGFEVAWLDDARRERYLGQVDAALAAQAAI